MSESIDEKSQSDAPVLRSVERHDAHNEAQDYNEATAELASFSEPSVLHRGRNPLAELRGATLIGIDEAGRGPLFGRVYAAAVLLHEGFDVSRVKDSKKFTSEKKRAEAAAYIKANSVWSVTYMDEGVIDKINVLQATMRAMHTAIHGVIQIKSDEERNITLLVDGNYFKPLFRLNGDKLEQVPHMCIEKGDAIHPCISAASILAKVARDDYVVEMCLQHPELDRYGLRKNKGYGTKAHRDAIQQFGLSDWHRKSFVLKES